MCSTFEKRIHLNILPQRLLQVELKDYLSSLPETINMMITVILSVLMVVVFLQINVTEILAKPQTKSTHSQSPEADEMHLKDDGTFSCNKTDCEELEHHIQTENTFKSRNLQMFPLWNLGNPANATATPNNMFEAFRQRIRDAITNYLKMIGLYQ